MKKILAALLCLCFVLPLAAGCGSGIVDAPETVPAPTAETAPAPVPTEPETTWPVRSVKSPWKERPNYVLSEDATPEEMRAMAVKAMRDMLTIPWYPDRTLDYEFTSAVSKNIVPFRLPESNIYAGLPYTNGITGIFQFLEYYDFETGRVACPSGEAFNSMLGNQCSGGVIWGVCPVASSVFYRSIGQRRADGVLPVGDYWLPSVSEENSAQVICEKNGVQTMYEAYAKMLPADWVTSNEHVMMVNEVPVVVRNADGTINGKESYLMIQDQHRGQVSTSSVFVVKEDGETHHYSGHLSQKFTFEDFYQKNYLPLTCAEFQGLKPYTMPAVKTDIEIASLDDLGRATLSSEYNLCVFYYDLVDAAGESAYSRFIITTYSNMLSEILKDYPLSNLRLSKTTLSRSTGLKGDYTLVLTCRDATGSTFEFARFGVTL